VLAGMFISVCFEFEKVDMIGHSAIIAVLFTIMSAGYLNSGRSIERDFMIWSVIEPGASAPFRIDFDGIRYRKLPNARLLT
jgi:hypothetical protein